MKEKIFDRGRLGFAETVRNGFAYLLPLGFSISSMSDLLVRFESPLIYIDVFHDDRSYEIGLSLGSRQDPTQRYSLGQLLRLAGDAAASSYRDYATRSPEGVIDGVDRLAALFKRQVELGILGDESLFSKLAEKKKESGRAMAVNSRLRVDREAAEKAWHNKDYKQIATLLEPLEQYLSPVERKRLEFARRHLGREYGG